MPLNYFESVICSTCLEGINPLGENICKKCGRPLFLEVPTQICLSCIENPPLYTIHRSVSLYDGIVKEMILLLKFEKLKILGKVLAKMAYEKLKENNTVFDCDILIPVPISKKRKLERGFNQSEEIARELSNLIKKKLVRNVLVKKIETIPQSLLPMRERRKNIIGSFEVKNAEFIKGRRILLVDDIYTTGSTISECCKVLLRSGAEEVKVLTIARAGSGYSPLTLEMLDS